MSGVRGLVGVIAILVVPSGITAQPEGCPQGGATGTLNGTVRDSAGLMVLPGVEVHVQWEGGRAEGRSSAAGTYELCGLPPGLALVGLARFAGFSSRVLPFEVVGGEVVVHDFLIPFTEGARETEELGRLVGSVVDAETARPVDAAVVGLVGHAYQALTDSAGRFVLENVPAGQQRLELRHLAYGTQQASVTVKAGASVLVRVQLAARPIEVEPIRVTVTGIRELGLEIRGFYERRDWAEKLGRGYFFTAEDIERRRPRLISHMIADLPSVRLDCGRSLGGQTCELRFTSNPVTEGCQRASVYINHARVIRSEGPRGGAHALDELILPIEVAGVEVYPGAASLPAEFAGSSGSCGAIVIWTK